MSTRSTAVYPGTFDPLTRGHEDIARRAASIFGRVVIAVAANPNKAPMFSVDERVELARGVLADLKNVEITGYSGLTVDLARAHDLAVIVRGLRAVSDFLRRISGWEERLPNVKVKSRRVCPTCLICLSSALRLD